MQIVCGVKLMFKLTRVERHESFMFSFYDEFCTSLYSQHIAQCRDERNINEEGVKICHKQRMFMVIDI